MENQPMTPDLKMLVEEFERAINESVCESDRIAAIVTDMKQAGYDITLVLEATIGVSASQDAAVPTPAPVRSSNGEIQLTDQDCKFLRALKIAPEA
jgi:hypothetical protein